MLTFSGIRCLLVILGAVQPQVPEEMGAIANLKVRRNAWSHRAPCSHLKETVKQVRLLCFVPYKKPQCWVPTSFSLFVYNGLPLFFIEWDFVLKLIVWVRGLWRWEDNFVRAAFFFYLYMGSRNQAQVSRLALGKCLCPQSFSHPWGKIVFSNY